MSVARCHLCGKPVTGKPGRYKRSWFQLVGGRCPAKHNLKPAFTVDSAEGNLVWPDDVPTPGELKGKNW